MIHIEGRIPKLLVLVGFCLLFGGIFAIAGLALLKPLFGLSIENAAVLMSDSSGKGNINALKFLQLFNTIGLFVFPSILFILLFYKNPLDEIRLNKSLTLTNVLGIVLLYISLMPLINYMVLLNGQMQLPEAFSAVEQWMRAAEEKAADLTKVFLEMNSTADLLFNLFLIAVLPAVGEELLFRGIIQRTINKGLRNKHIGIWISAILFSALHMQFFGFFPRLFLGAFFGYLLLWTGSLWAPILAHFLNNGTAVVLNYVLDKQTLEKEVDQLGASEGTFAYSIVAVFIFSTLCYFFYQYNKKSRNF